MAESFSDPNNNAGSGKRPAPTIEGTATEVSIEPASEDAASPTIEGAAPAVAVEPASDDPAASPDVSADAPQSQLGAPKPGAKTAPPRTSAFELRSFLTHLAAGLLGGLVGVLALAFAWNKLPIRTAEAPDVSVLQRRLAKLEAVPAPAGDAKALALLDTRIKTLEERKVEPAPDLSGLTSRVTRLEESIDALAKTADNGGSVADAAALETKIGDIEQRLQTKIDTALGAEEATNAKGVEALQGEVAALKAKLGALAEAKLATDETDVSPELTALDQRIAKVEAALPDLSSAIDQGAASAKSGAAAIAFANLREAVSAGRPYATELAALRSLAPGIGDFGALPAHAETGIQTIPELVRAFLKVAEASPPAAPARADDSFLGSVISSAKSAVKIRRTDAAATGDEPGAVLARAGAQLKQGDLALAMKEVETLPAPSRDAFAGWLDDARARASANETLSNLESALLLSMGGATDEAKP